MEKITEAHGGGAVRGHWTDIDPTKYDEPLEVPGLKLDAGSFISPYDVPDGVRLGRSGEKRYLIELRYLTDQEKIEFTETELPEICFRLGCLSNRLEGAAHGASVLLPSLTRPRLRRVSEFADRGRGGADGRLVSRERPSLTS